MVAVVVEFVMKLLLGVIMMVTPMEMELDRFAPIPLADSLVHARSDKIRPCEQLRIDAGRTCDGEPTGAFQIPQFLAL